MSCTAPNAAAVVQLDDEVVDPPRPLPWYPNNLAWHMNFSRGQLRKLSWLEEIHEFMKAANDAGSITRQEAVSMVPPLFMDVQPDHKVRQ
jgi:16S rRNA C967 or C1407 C5-methylase (RsmB/RsmF family)